MSDDQSDNKKTIIGTTPVAAGENGASRRTPTNDAGRYAMSKPGDRTVVIPEQAPPAPRKSPTMPGVNVTPDPPVRPTMPGMSVGPQESTIISAKPPVVVRGATPPGAATVVVAPQAAPRPPVV